MRNIRDREYEYEEALEKFDEWSTLDAYEAAAEAAEAAGYIVDESVQLEDFLPTQPQEVTVRHADGTVTIRKMTDKELAALQAVQRQEE